METMRVLPDMEGRRFGSLALGYDRVQQVRDEHTVLLGLAALLTGLPAERVTVSNVEGLTRQLQMLLAVQPPTGTLVERLSALPTTSTYLEVIACALASTTPVPASP